jgi:hypothetical protein
MRYYDDYDPPPRPTFSFEEYKVSTERVYTHINGYKYTLHEDQALWPGQTYCVPYPGQGMDDTPRYLSTGNLRDEGGNVPNTHSPDAPFNVGEIVKLKTGTAPIKITSCNKNFLSGDYLNTNHKIHCRTVNDFELHPDYQQKENAMSNAQTLYQFNLKDTLTGTETQHFGHYLATNSAGQWVMEVRGTGQLVTVDKASVEEVLPYTVGVKFMNSSSTSIYHYFSEKDKFGEGFYLMKDREGYTVIVQLVFLDTKSKSATKDFAPIGKLAVDMY